MNREIAPTTMAPPAANYAHAVLVQQPASWLYTSGVVPIASDGTVPEPIAEQADVVWANLLALLAEAGMAPTDVVSVTTYVVVEHMAALPLVMAARDRHLGGHRVASTLVTVPALARPEWKMEIALVAAR
ncbi:MAG: Rid family hydrolase [Actinomycetota bacterium]|nr:Rid family hydrolase [Actinomycetota bacterium]